MTGIVFFGTTDRDRIVAFYRDRLDFSMWLEQPDCTILRYDTLLVGFCERKEADTDGVVTVVYDTESAGDERADSLEDVAQNPTRYTTSSGPTPTAGPSRCRRSATTSTHREPVRHGLTCRVDTVRGHRSATVV